MVFETKNHQHQVYTTARKICKAPIKIRINVSVTQNIIVSLKR